jgi:DNA-binding NarL/FixJ family response regulator
MSNASTERFQPLRILIADDHTFFRRGVREVIEEEDDMEVVGEATDGEEAIQRIRELRPDGLDLVLMDVDMPCLDGIAATKRILAEDPGLPVVMLTVSTLDRDLFAAARSGAVGFLSKGLSPTALVRALRDFCREGALPMSPTMAAKVLAHFQQATASAAPNAAAMDEAVQEQVESPLTAREREVVQLIAQGARDRDIAERLILTEHTVKKHVKSILRKLGARNRAEAAARLRRPWL